MSLNNSMQAIIKAQRPVVEGDEAVCREDAIIRTFASAYKSLEGFGTNQMRIRMAVELASHEAQSSLTYEELHEMIAQRTAKFESVEGAYLASIAANISDATIKEFDKCLAAFDSEIEKISVQIKDWYRDIEAAEEHLEELREARHKESNDRFTHMGTLEARNKTELTNLRRRLERTQAALANFKRAEKILQSL